MSKLVHIAAGFAKKLVKQASLGQSVSWLTEWSPLLLLLLLLQSGCGRGDVDGDGVTPLCIAQLPGAEELVLPGVWHNPRRKAGQLWYGDAAVRKQWQQFLIDPNQDNSDTKI